MAKTVFKLQIDFLSTVLENVKIKYKILPSGETTKKGKKAASKVHLDIEEVLCQGRDVRWVFNQKALEQLALEDYQKQVAMGIQNVPDQD